MHRRSRHKSPTHALVGPHEPTFEGRSRAAVRAGNDVFDVNGYFGYFFFFYAFEHTGGMST